MTDLMKQDSGLTGRLPTHDEIQSAAEASTAIAIAMDRDGSLKVNGLDGPVHIAPAIGSLMIELLGHISKGDMVTLVPIGAMLTTQQAADMLNVSRPYFVGLLKRGDIPFTQVGAHRRVRFTDLTAYQDRMAKKKDDALDELTRLGQEYDAAS